MSRCDDAAAFADRDDLICVHISEALDFLGRGPLDLNGVDDLRLAQPEM